ncbi:hypothetical protein [Brevibacillus laterosporus]|uniref:hypothetical protein n=1 Tax=Brevibacillus laterosporus TaxID=1465 RepID=UPI003D227698
MEKKLTLTERQRESLGFHVLITGSFMVIMTLLSSFNLPWYLSILAVLGSLSWAYETYIARKYLGFGRKKKDEAAEEEN